MEFLLLFPTYFILYRTNRWTLCVGVHDTLQLLRFALYLLPAVGNHHFH